MPDWATFAAFAAVVTTGLLALSYASRGVISHDDEPPQRTGTRLRSLSEDESASEAEADGTDAADETATAESDAPTDFAGPTGTGERPADTTAEPTETTAEPADTAAEPTPTRAEDVSREFVLPKSGVRYRSAPSEETAELSTAALLANVAFSQGVFAVALLAGAWYAQIPASAFGAHVETLSLSGLLLGVGLGVALYAANEVGAAVGAAYGLGSSEELRGALAPDSKGGWAVLLLVVLPLIAGFEELLFRGALVGVFAAGFSVSPWLLALLSSVAFALGHGAQGRLGVLVTGTLGFVLAAAFVVTGSLFVVVVAHYLVNALEFVVHEGLGFEWTNRPGFGDDAD
ncbi:CPBP family intramembrane glutamic endopeptidase [Halogeometricum limi]|uniref:Membrane protease YdiL, CAAX protease family n=1 Tax=Halogeometricum limi TaxID=555875 RepID=A0A1I6G759_9EURY|nr:type II CAAX endopeptidase family protein [Halogeometricum limi]SFR38022.1 Membrane protease YdiL, CAAX protease family [Halogeometricum limi]